MAVLRHYILRHRLLAVWLIAAALLMKVLVPTGYMASTSAGSIVIEICTGYGPQKMVMAMPGMEHHQDKKRDHGKAGAPCAFSGLSAPSLAAADPLVLALAFAFIMAGVFRLAIAGAVATPAFLRPPSRGPPALS